MKTKSSAGDAPGNFKILIRKASPGKSTIPPQNINQLRHEAFDFLPSTININRRATSKAGQIPDLYGSPINKRDTFQDILTDGQVPVIPQRWVQFVDMATSVFIVLKTPAEYNMEWTP